MDIELIYMLLRYGYLFVCHQSVGILSFSISSLFSIEYLTLYSGKYKVRHTDVSVQRVNWHGSLINFQDI